MPWTWIRPADPSLLEARPLLDVGTGDGQTLRVLVSPGGLVVGVDRSVAPLRTVAGTHDIRIATAEAAQLPFVSGIFAVVIAGDLFHHLDDDALAVVLAEINRVLIDGTGTLVAWWYREAGRPGVDAPRHPRSYEALAAHLEGFAEVQPLELVATVDAGPPTVGVRARR